MDKSLKKMNRMELLRLLVQASETNEALVAENGELRKVAAEAQQRRPLQAAKVGSIAEAALQANGYFEAAQRSADDYLREIKRLRDQVAARAGSQVQQAPQAQTAAPQPTQEQVQAQIQAQVQAQVQAYQRRIQEQAQAHLQAQQRNMQAQLRAQQEQLNARQEQLEIRARALDQQAQTQRQGGLHAQVPSVMPESALHSAAQVPEVVQDAQEQASTIVSQANAKARAMLSDAQAKSEAIVARANQQAHEIISQANRRADMLLSAAGANTQKDEISADSLVRRGRHIKMDSGVEQ